MVAIRRAFVGDASEIARVHVESWRTTYAGIVSADYLSSLNEEERASQWQTSLRSGKNVYVAQQGETIIGFAAGGSILDSVPGYEAELYAIYLVEHFQGQGVGKQLLHAIASSQLADGFTNMIAWVLEDNPSIAFYKACGAMLCARKRITLGSDDLVAIAYGWPDLQTLLAKSL